MEDQTIVQQLMVLFYMFQKENGAMMTVRPKHMKHRDVMILEGILRMHPDIFQIALQNKNRSQLIHICFPVFTAHFPFNERPGRRHGTHPFIPEHNLKSGPPL